jgi:hypothetical protein
VLKTFSGVFNFWAFGAKSKKKKKKTEQSPKKEGSKPMVLTFVFTLDEEAWPHQICGTQG